MRQSTWSRCGELRASSGVCSPLNKRNAQSCENDGGALKYEMRDERIVVVVSRFVELPLFAFFKCASPTKNYLEPNSRKSSKLTQQVLREENENTGDCYSNGEDESGEEPAQSLQLSSTVVQQLVTELEGVESLNAESLLESIRGLKK
ncbi:unnamed protein product [Hydatigera taeniaeformis]|uniref:Uncharacterized protein n=1 Tax=Hydatigena taeniaeformis TaxID=6205 RepID=A0A0R3XD95_HYDTA|nr:unnamed protein product [Hydatigera taeniaeformis]